VEDRAILAPGRSLTLDVPIGTMTCRDDFVFHASDADAQTRGNRSSATANKSNQLAHIDGASE
jgi:hypothetical protein